MKKIEDILKNKRTKTFGIFIVALALFIEIPLRALCHQLSEFLLISLKETFLVGKAATIAREIFIQGSPLIFLYFPALIGLIIIVRDGFQKTDWVFGPFLIGILFKAGVYGMISLKHQSGEFWQLFQAGIPHFLLSFFLYIFIFATIGGLFIWMRDILRG